MQTKSTTQKLLSFLLLLTILLTGMASCKKDKNDPPPPPPGTTTIQEYKNGEEFIRFAYNTDGTVKNITLKDELNTNDNIVDYAIAYNSAKKIIAVETSAGEKIVPVYENSILIRADIFDSGERTGFNNYLYENGRLKRVTMYWGSGNDFQPFFEFNFTYNSAGNLTETIYMMATNIPGQLVRAGHIAYQHDQKTNPLYAEADLLALLGVAISKNNITQEDHFDENLVPQTRYTYNYTYQANGLPSHAEIKNGLPGQPQVISQADFIYK